MITSPPLLLRNLLLATIICINALAQGASEPKKVLVVTVTKGFRHSSIPTAEKILAKLALTDGHFELDYARVDPNSPEYKDASGKVDNSKVDTAIQAVLTAKLNREALSKLDGVIFANTTGDLPLPDKDAFLEWLKSGKAFVGMHSCSDTFHGWPSFINMLGGEFKTHGSQVGVECVVADPKHPATKHLGQTFSVPQEEIYLLKNYDATAVHELLVLDKHPNEKTPGHYAVSWCKEFGKGRVFYTSLGHREDIWDAETPVGFDRKNPPEVSHAFQKHILGGIKWALALDSARAP